MILTPVHSEKLSEPTEHGTRNTTGGITSLYLSNTRHDHASHVRYARNAQDQKMREYFQEAHLQNITKEIAGHLRRKNTFIRDVRL